MVWQDLLQQDQTLTATQLWKGADLSAIQMKETQQHLVEVIVPMHLKAGLQERNLHLQDHNHNLLILHLQDQMAVDRVVVVHQEAAEEAVAVEQDQQELVEGSSN